MKRSFLLLNSLVIAIAIAFTSCKKDDETIPSKNELILGSWESVSARFRYFDAEGDMEKDTTKIISGYTFKFEKDSSCTFAGGDNPLITKYYIKGDSIFIGNQGGFLEKLDKANFSVVFTDYQTGFGGKSKILETMNFKKAQ